MDSGGARDRAGEEEGCGGSSNGRGHRAYLLEELAQQGGAMGPCFLCAGGCEQHLEPLGMLRQNNLDPAIKRADTPPAMRKHREWIKDLEEEVQHQKMAEEIAAEKQKVKFLGAREHMAAQRRNVKQLLDEANEQGKTIDDANFIDELMEVVENKKKPKYAFEDQKK